MKNLLTAILSVGTLALASANTYETISVAKCDSIRTAHFADPDFYIIDVRTAGEYASGHLPNSYNIDYRGADFSDIVDTLDRSATYLVHCQSGGRSAGAMTVFEDKAFETVYEMQGGYRNWTFASTKESYHQILRYADEDIAFVASKMEKAGIFNAADSLSNAQFSIPGSSLIAGGSAQCIDSLTLRDKADPILLYSSSEVDLDTLFFYLFTEGYQQVYYFNEAPDAWINAGYAYNTSDDETIDEPNTTSASEVGYDQLALISQTSDEIFVRSGASVVSLCTAQGICVYSAKVAGHVASIPVNMLHGCVYICADGQCLTVYLP